MNSQLANVCRQMLDNADLSLDLSAYPNIDMRFVVFGAIHDKFWEVQFECVRTIGLEIRNDNDVGPHDLHMVLEVSVESMQIKDCDPRLLKRFSASPDASVWLIKIYGDLVIDLICSDFKWALSEMTSDAYQARYA